MFQRFVILTALLSWTSTFYALAAIQDCYYYTGELAPNNTVCSDSGACCGVGATCTAERLCHNPGDPATVFVRGPCVRSDWSLVECPQICLYDESNGVFPRVRQCKDGSWCCYNVDTGDNGETCCTQGQGVFLNNDGVISSSPASSTSTSSTKTSTGTTAGGTSTSDSTSNTPSPTSSDSSGLSTGAKVGLGVGVVLGVLLLAAAGVIIWLLARRRKKEAPQSKEANMGPPDEMRAYYASQHHANYESYQSRAISEAPGTVPAEMHSEATRFEADNQAVSPQELPAHRISRGGKAGLGAMTRV